MDDGLLAENRVVLHLGKFVRIQLAGFEQDSVRHADLADVVQRGRFEQQIDGLGGQLGAKAGCSQRVSASSRT